MPNTSESHRRKPREDGLRSRRTILATAAKLATLEGLEGLSIGRLASEIGMSKSGLYAHFGSKEELQLATLEAARQVFVKEVVMPALQVEPGLARVRRLCESFLSYLERGVFPGGCFFAIVATEFSSRPGPVRDRIAAIQKEWVSLIVTAIEGACQAGELPSATDAPQLAYELNALLVSANTAFLLHDDPMALERSRRAFEDRLARALENPSG